MSFSFTLEQTDSKTQGRAGLWATPHGTVETPTFMPVGTLGTVKGLLPEQLKAVGVQQVLANTYHLALRPGAAVVASLGGLHEFMQWDGPILTDSGGFQVFSLAQLNRFDDHQVVFKSHIDGSLFELSPERAVEIQEQLGADVIMCLDVCPALPAETEQLAEAVRKTTLWAQRCREAHSRDDQALFGIVQGGIDRAMRERSATELLALDFPGYAIGGLSVGEPPPQMYSTLDFTVPHLPDHKPRYLMGVGRPEDLIEAVSRGMDLFDCVMPTRNGRNALAFTSRGPIRLRNACHRKDERPLDTNCHCPVCCRFSRGYLRHLFQADEMLGPILLSWHNIAFYQQLMQEMRGAIKRQELAQFRHDRLAQWS